MSEQTSRATQAPLGVVSWALEATTDNVILLDREFRITFINRATATLNGITQDSVLGRSIWDVWPGNLGTDIERNYRRAMAEGVPVRFVHSYFEGGRFDLYLEISAYPSPDGLAIFFHDVSDVRREAARKADDEARLDRAIRATDLGVWRVNLPFDGTPFYLSSQVRHHFGITEDEEVAMPEFVALLHPDDVEHTGAGITRAINEHVPYDVVYRTIAPDKKTRWVRAVGNAFYREDGTPYQFDGYTLDYTERVETEIELRAAKARVDAILASADVGTWALDVLRDRANGDVNLAALFGMTPQEASAGRAADYIGRIHPEDQAQVSETLARSLAEGSRYDTEFRVLVDGRERSLVARGVPELDETGVVVRLPGVVVDITRLKNAQAGEKAALEETKASEARFRQLVELSPSTVWFAEPDGGLSFISQDFYDTTGLTPEAALPHGWASTVHPDDRQGVAKKWETSRATEAPYDTEFRIRNRDGEYRWISARALPVRNGDGLVTGWMGSNSDIHERKTAEEILRQAVAERTQELERSVKEAEGFNYSISHDLRAPLRAIVATASILLEEAAPTLTPKHRELLVRQSLAAKRLATLIDELLLLSRLARVDVQREHFDFSAKSQSVVEEFETCCRFRIQPGMMAVGDRALVRTVLENLIGNACKFSPQGGCIEIGEQDGVFFVRDEGVGFDMQYAPKIFLPFERLVLESEFPGTGIGLANVKRIIERHGGRVWAASEVGAGSTFFFTLSDKKLDPEVSPLQMTLSG